MTSPGSWRGFIPEEEKDEAIQHWFWKAQLNNLQKAPASLYLHNKKIPPPSYSLICRPQEEQLLRLDAIKAFVQCVFDHEKEWVRKSVSWNIKRLCKKHPHHLIFSHDIQGTNKRSFCGKDGVFHRVNSLLILVSLLTVLINLANQHRLMLDDLPLKRRWQR